jgi:serine/threonine-protein kinase
MAEGSGTDRGPEDARLARAALERGWLTAQQLRTAFVEQEAAQGRPLGEILVERGYLSREQLAILTSGNATFTATATPPGSPAASLPPLGKFTLLRELGRGGMGTVYEAYDTASRRTVALKILASSPHARPGETGPEDERFLREANLAQSLPDHPNLVRVLESGALGERRYIAMELVPGPSLSEWRRQGSVTVRQYVAVLRDVALAAHHAHEHGIVHRDLKPENILIDPDGRPRVTDFGLAKIVGAPPDSSVTGGHSIGTPAYMSPEQVQGRRDLDRRTDVFAIGVMLYELLTGRRPFEGQTPFETMTKVVHAEVLPPSKITRLQINPLLYKNLENICLIALSKEPSDRYPTAQALAEDLTLWLKGEDFKVILPRRWRRWRARRTLVRAAAAAAALGILAGLFLLARGSGGTPAPSPAPAAPKPAPALRPGAIGECWAGFNFNALGIRRIDLRASFDDRAEKLWPDPPGYFLSRRWTGYLRVPKSGRYAFRTSGLDGVRLVVDDVPVISRWAPRPRTEEVSELTLEEGLHRLTLEHVRDGDADVHLSWRAQDRSAFAALGPADLLHDPAAFAPSAAPRPGESGPIPVAGAQEGESLPVLPTGAAAPDRGRGYWPYRMLWRGRWSGGHLWWGYPARPGDRLRLAFQSPAAGPRTLVLALTRAADHGIFRISVNGRTIAEALDLYDPDLRTGPIEFDGVELKEGVNELEFEVAGSNPAAREWGIGGGVCKLGLDYVVVR